MKSATGVWSTQQELFRLIESDLREVDRRLISEAHSSLPLINDINEYLHNSGGKRLRPALLLLCSRLCGFQGDPSIQMGVVVELIHVATLVHDDIIDNAKLRRGQPSVNAEWGNQITVLLGDWLYMTSFWLALRHQNFRILDVLIDITRRMVEGELLQLQEKWKLDLPVDTYLEITQRKTAHLFSGCGRLGGILAGAAEEQEEKLAAFGESVGMAFQLIDDLLDYTSDVRTLGKPVLKDLEEGKVTLPIIFLMQRARPAERQFLRRVVDERNFSPANKKKIIDLVLQYDTLSELRRLAEQYARRATRALSSFPDSVYREVLAQIPELVLCRNH